MSYISYTTENGVKCVFLDNARDSYGQGLTLVLIESEPADGVFNIPAKVGNHRVINIHKNALAFSGIFFVTFPETMSVIPEGIFEYCHDIQEITIKNKNCEFRETFENLKPPLPSENHLLEIKYRRGGLTEADLQTRPVPDWLDLKLTCIKNESKIKEVIHRKESFRENEER